MRTAVRVCIALAACVPMNARTHPASPGWTYPPACCQGSARSGECHRLPSSHVKKGRNGFSILVHPGEHPIVTKRQQFLVPYGSELPSGDGDFHICLYPTQDHVNCFFAPPDGV